MNKQSKEITKLVPILNEGIKIQPSELGQYLITHVVSQKYYIINEQLFKVLDAIDGKMNLLELCKKLNEQHQMDLTTRLLHQLLYVQVASKVPIFNDIILRSVTANYVQWSVPLLQIHTVSPISTALKYLFNGKYLFLNTLFFIIAAIIFFNTHHEIFYVSCANMSVWLFLSTILITLLLSIWHELGHATACKFIGAEHGVIGFGFYLLFPVFYTDVTHVWAYNRKSRLLVNLGGIYFEMIVINLLLLAILIFNIKNTLLIFLCTSFIFNMLYQLNPFMRTDGYWIISDVTNNYNIQERSNLLFWNFIKGKSNNYTRNEIFLIGYGILNIIFIVSFIGYILFCYPVSIFELPFALLSWIRESIIKFPNFNLLKLATLLPCFFSYILLMRLIVNFIKNKMQKDEK